MKVQGKRPSWDSYFMQMAHVVSERSTCLRRQVGAVMVKDKQILCTGYNGSPSGLQHCDEIGCLRQSLSIPSGERHEICRAVHAEQNALVQAAKHGVAITGADLYTTHQPCVLCTKLLINVGIKRVFYHYPYPDQLAVDMAKEAGLELIHFEEDISKL
ncbi:deoxycytidylate deaminase [Desulfosporosinus sp. SB140]|uniref:deoxycytidylate deaminase n=1 Tax=Desulfosporosinus paludis TaxID=3115649 RepID=UPI00388EC61B